ncbi:MAG: hypothetical protein JXA20_18140 [Spirochaetes bacterium]|nr:hypothetical protein [Spirochaetota bacterium]
MITFVSASVLVALCALSSPSHAQSGSGDELGRFEFEFNPVGFLQYGPMVNMGVRLGPVTFIDFHVRYPYAGVLYQVLETDGFDRTASPDCAGVGGRINNVIRLGASPHAWYIGALGEYTWGGSEWKGTGRNGYDVTYERTWKGYTIALNAGFRWRFSSGFYMNLGGIIGIHNQYRASISTPLMGYYKEDDPEGCGSSG